ncbi:MAG: DUF4160 domain-containing protein [candidate division KSB1 bacterium]|nr:DUF4160 domain-containing protein [candidate division KSB1 bacterium]MDZ7368404.1 DUF4160 domain-containing protein [candidate division KSB1 bacterium]MDZ7406020.1 DUF4160 domain-containing protein [candidate division KSB1 bacterium]
MPTVLQTEGFRFFFYAKDCQEPIHVHVTRGNGLAKVWVEILKIASSVGFRPHEENRIVKIIADNQAYIIMRWRQFCGE